MLGGYIALTKLSAMQELTTSGKRLDLIRAVGNIPKYLNPERSLISVLLINGAPGELRTSPGAAEFINGTDAAVASAESAIAAAQALDDGAHVRERMDEAFRLFKQYRQLSEEKIRLPVDQRGDAGAASARLGQAMNDVVSQVLSEQVWRMASSGGEAYRDVNFADRTW